MAQQQERGPVQRGDALPFFDVTAVDGTRVRYADLWQRKNVVIVTLPARFTTGTAKYAAELSSRTADFDAYCAVCVVTGETIPGLPAPGVVVADRWGEIDYAETSVDIPHLPTIDGLLDTLDYIQRKCPECEGESR